MLTTKKIPMDDVGRKMRMESKHVTKKKFKTKATKQEKKGTKKLQYGKNQQNGNCIFSY
jgi:hypothetical protein